MRTSWKLLAAGVLALGQGSADDDRTQVQDPPGEVDVRQPADVSLPERNTERDATDTLRGGGRTDVIEGEAGARAGPDIRASEGRGTVEQGTEARARFEGGTGSAATPPEDAATGDTDAAADDTAESTSLGTDLGYGTATEAPSLDR